MTEPTHTQYRDPFEPETALTRAPFALPHDERWLVVHLIMNALRAECEVLPPRPRKVESDGTVTLGPQSKVPVFLGTFKKRCKVIGRAAKIVWMVL